MRTRPAEIEQHIARCRVVLSIAAMCSVYIDPTAPTLSRWLFLTGGPFMIGAHALAALGCHLLYAVGVYVWVMRGAVSEPRLATLTTWGDVLFGAAIAAVTEGATSPAHVFFAFAILAVGCRERFPFTLEVTVVCVALYLGMILLSADRGTASTYIMRPAYLAITGYVIGYLAEQRVSLAARAHELEGRAERQSIARSLHDGYVQALAGVNLRLESCRELLRRERSEDALTELTELQSGVRREYDEVRAYLRSLVDLERRPAEPRDRAGTLFAVRADFAAPGPVLEHVLQIMLEAVRNTRQHAQATSAAISACASGTRLRLTIDDDGVGFREGAQPPWTIASRVAEIGGGVRIAQAAPGGAHLLIEIPLR